VLPPLPVLSGKAVDGAGYFEIVVIVLFAIHFRRAAPVASRAIAEPK
jgi:hypothetical protein